MDHGEGKSALKKQFNIRPSKKKAHKKNRKLET